MGRSLVLSDDVIRSLLLNDKAIKEFPFLATYKKHLTTRKRSCCGKRRSQVMNQRQAVANARSSITCMSPEAKKRLKTVLGADEITYFCRTKEGVQKVTI